MLGLTYVLQSTCVHHSCKTILVCINANLLGKLPPVAPNVNALVFIVCINCVLALILGSLHATPYYGMCISIFQQIIKMYDIRTKQKQPGAIKKGSGQTK